MALALALLNLQREEWFFANDVSEGFGDLLAPKFVIDFGKLFIAKNPRIFRNHKDLQMHVSVIINASAGSVNETLIKNKISEALFRCELAFAVPGSLEEMREFIIENIEAHTDALIVCGGDGTINAVLQVVMPLAQAGTAVPGLCIVSSGTANDLAYELGVDRKIQSAVRALLEGAPRKIDVIEVSSGDEKKFMVTCGGLGVLSRTAGLANSVRSTLRQLGARRETHPFLRWLSLSSYKAIKGLGASIYSLLLFYSYQTWDESQWEIEIQPQGKKKFRTRSGFIFVNNQPSLGSHFFPAPYTANDDGLVNVLVAPVQGWISLLLTMLQIQSGNLQWDCPNSSLETTEVRFQDVGAQGRLCFFGDGEILFPAASEIHVRCLRRALHFYINS